MPSSIYTKPSALALCLVLSACGGGGKSDNSNKAEHETTTDITNNAEASNKPREPNSSDFYIESNIDNKELVSNTDIRTYIEQIVGGIEDKAIVDAGKNQTNAVGNKIWLQGKIKNKENYGSYDVGPYIPGLEPWQLISEPEGAQVSFSNHLSHDLFRYIEADKEGVYVFSLGLIDEDGVKYTDTVSITLSNDLRTKYIKEETQKLKAAQEKWQQLNTQSYLITHESRQLDCTGCSYLMAFQTSSHLIENNKVTAAYQASISNDDELTTPEGIIPYRSSLTVELITAIEEQLLNIEEQLENNINNISPINFVKYDEEKGYPITESFYNRYIQESDSTDSFSVIPLDQADCTNNPSLFAPVKLNVFDNETNEAINCNVRVIGENEVQNNKNIVLVDSFNVHIETWSYCLDDATILLTPDDLAETITIEKEGYHSQTVEIENTNQDCSLMPIELDVYLEQQ